MPDVSGVTAEALPRDFTTLAITSFTQKVALETLDGLSKLPKLPKRELR